MVIDNLDSPHDEIIAGLGQPKRAKIRIVCNKYTLISAY
jgi:hypothetical protein